MESVLEESARSISWVTGFTYCGRRWDDRASLASGVRDQWVPRVDDRLVAERPDDRWRFCRLTRRGVMVCGANGDIRPVDSMSADSFSSRLLYST